MKLRKVIAQWITCTSCRQTQMGGFALQIGADTVMLCEKCERVLERLVRRAKGRRLSDAEKA